MKKAWIGIVLLAALLLSACGQDAAPEAPAPTTAAATEAATVPTTTETTEPPCEHQWSEATYFTPAVCVLCGEEGEKKPSFFEEHGLDIEESPLNGSRSRDLETEGTMYSLKNSTVEPSLVNVQIQGWDTAPARTPQPDIYYVDAEEGFQKIQFNIKIDFLAKICADGTLLDQGGFNYGFYDYYTGAWLHPSTLAKNGEDSFTYELEIDGTAYTIECTNTFRRDNLSPKHQDDGSSKIEAWLNDSYNFKVPFEYDGLVFGVLPCRDGRGMNKNENGEFVTNLCEEANFEEGVYFRLNGSVCPWEVVPN